MNDDVIDRYNLDDNLQRDIIGLMILDNDFLLKSYKLIKSEYFVNDSHQVIFNIIKNYFDNYNLNINNDILKNEIHEKYNDSKNLAKYLTELDCILERFDDAIKEKNYIYNAVVTFAKNQAMKEAILESVECLEKHDYSSIEQKIKEALLVSPDFDLGIDYFNDIDERYSVYLKSLEGDRFPTGISAIDYVLKGGLGKKEIGMVFAPSGVGKSIFLCKVALENMLRGKNVLYISLEMSRELIAIRIDSMLSHLEINSIHSNIKELKNKIDLVKKNVKGRLRIQEFPAGYAAISDLRAYTNQLQNYTNFDPDVIILDYIDELSTRKNSDLYESQKIATTEFRGWCKIDNICGFTATQSNRMAKQAKIITDEHIGDSYGKFRVVDGMWSLNQTDEEKVKGVMRGFVVKHRNAQSRYIFYLSMNSQNLRINEISEDEYNKKMGIE